MGGRFRGGRRCAWVCGDVGQGEVVGLCGGFDERCYGWEGVWRFGVDGGDGGWEGWRVCGVCAAISFPAASGLREVGVQDGEVEDEQD